MYHFKQHLFFVGACLLSFLLNANAKSQTCSGHDYSAVFKPSDDGLDFRNVPGFTRSAYYRDHALITAESRVWAPLFAWKNTRGSILITPASGAQFSMYIASMGIASVAAPPPSRAERFVMITDGSATMTKPDGETITLGSNSYFFFPADTSATLTSEKGANLLIYERIYALNITEGPAPQLLHGDVESSPLLESSPEVFKLRKLLPQTPEYDFNIHIMDFEPGEYLWTKEIHYNQHGLMLLEGQGIYRLADKWYPVQAGDAIWMAPFVIQWYAALGNTATRYIIYKDVTLNPLFV